MKTPWDREMTICLVYAMVYLVEGHSSESLETFAKGRLTFNLLLTDLGAGRMCVWEYLWVQYFLS